MAPDADTHIENREMAEHAPCTRMTRTEIQECIKSLGGSLYANPLMLHELFNLMNPCRGADVNGC